MSFCSETGNGSTFWYRITVVFLETGHETSFVYAVFWILLPTVIVLVIDTFNRSLNTHLFVHCFTVFSIRLTTVIRRPWMTVLLTALYKLTILHYITITVRSLLVVSMSSHLLKVYFLIFNFSSAEDFIWCQFTVP